MSEFDCGFQRENRCFRYRAGGILTHDGKVLFVKSNFGDYFYIVGGAVEMGERSDVCAVREIFEETGIKADIDRLAVVCENFFHGVGGVIDGCDCHTIEFYYLLSASDADICVCRELNDEGEQLVWLPLEEIPNSDIKPTFIKECIDDIVHGSGMLHIIEERDR